MNRLSEYMEAVVTMLPVDAGGRRGSVSPRDGSYRPYARIANDGPTLRVRFIEGPPTLAPGESARIVLEVESGDFADDLLNSGTELQLFETGPQFVGLVTVGRLWRRATAV